jgi:hypothetical protein
MTPYETGMRPCKRPAVHKSRDVHWGRGFLGFFDNCTIVKKVLKSVTIDEGGVKNV